MQYCSTAAAITYRSASLISMVAGVAMQPQQQTDVKIYYVEIAGENKPE